MGIAFRIQKEALGGQALYPHVLVKNCAVEFNFGQRAEPYCSVLPGFTFIQHLPLSERIRGTVGPKSKAECEVSGPGRPNWRPPLQSHVVAKARGDAAARWLEQHSLSAEGVTLRPWSQGPLPPGFPRWGESGECGGCGLG